MQDTEFRKYWLELVWKFKRPIGFEQVCCFFSLSLARRWAGGTSRSFFLCSAEQSQAANWCCPSTCDCGFRSRSGLGALLQMVTLLKESNVAGSHNKSVVFLSGYQHHSTQLHCWAMTLGDLRLVGTNAWFLLLVIVSSCISSWYLDQLVDTPHA